MKLKPQSVLLLGVQLLCMGYLLLTGPLLAGLPWLWLELAGLGLLTWAVLTMQPRRVSPLPDLSADAQLVMRGPYRWVRHPMYTGVLVSFGALVSDQPTTARLVIWGILLMDLLLKLQYEEKLLRRRFPEYAAYQRRTKRLVPGVY